MREFGASLHFGAIRACFNLPALSAMPNRAHRFAVGRLCAVHAAPDAVDHRRCDFHTVEFGPFLGDFFAQRLVLVHRCDARFAFFAVKSAVGNQLVHGRMVGSCESMKSGMYMCLTVPSPMSILSIVSRSFLSSDRIFSKAPNSLPPSTLTRL